MVCSESAHARRALSFERYTEAGHVVMQPPDAAPSFETWFLQRYGVSRRVEVTTYSFASVPGLVAHADRIATVHRRLARIAQTSLPLTLLAPPMAMPTMEQSIQWHKHRTNDPGLIWLRRLMQGAVARMDEAVGSRKTGATPPSE